MFKGCDEIMKKFIIWAQLWLLGGSCVIAADLEQNFRHPPDAAKPWVYWYFMDGNRTAEGMLADEAAMKEAGIGGAIYLEVNLGMPIGPVVYMSREWQDLFELAVTNAQALGLQIALGTGPGWCGTGGPWITPDQAMQHLVGSATNVVGPAHFSGILPRPQPRTPYFGTNTLSGDLYTQWRNYYRDFAVLAFPTTGGTNRIDNIDQKALYYRAPYSSVAGVPPYLAALADVPSLPPNECIGTNQMVVLTTQMDTNGNLTWDVPAGNWTVLRLGRTLTGQTTRPAPTAGLGFECNKFDTNAVAAHFNDFIQPLLDRLGPITHTGSGWTMLHFDSWEMGSQNWSPNFRQDFQRLRGYDPLPYLPAMLGRVVQNNGVSERFLWDLRKTAQDLVKENHIGYLKKRGSREGFGLSVEPYDMNPVGDLELGTMADVPQCEFWAQGYGFRTEFSCLEAVSIAHTMGKSIVPAESFTAEPGEYWQWYPGNMKAQADWALCCGINRMIFHRYQHQPWLDRAPGMTMASYGVNWERTETWWSMASGFHEYLARCQALLQTGMPVADVLYLSPEGAPMVFYPPSSATSGTPPDRRGYNFDGCAPSTLLDRASVKNGRVIFPDGMSYRLLVLPEFNTMTPELLAKIKQLVLAGATIVGAPPKASPSLSNYPACDRRVALLAGDLWGTNGPVPVRAAGKGHVVFDTEANPPGGDRLQHDFSVARWIWYPEGNPASSAPVVTRYFQKSFTIPPEAKVAFANISATADNSFRLYINGQPALAGTSYPVIYSNKVAPMLQAGSNRIAVTAVNDGSSPNPAGLICALSITLEDGSNILVATDNSWSAAQSAGGPGQTALDLGAWNMNPWNLHWSISQPIYPSYDLTAQVLKKMGVAPDFQSDQRLRYIHRHDGKADFYFVANPSSADVVAQCSFRVAGMQPEWWNPVTGERRLLPRFTLTNGITRMPLEFGPTESAFIVFRKPLGRQTHTRTAGNFQQAASVMTVTGPWHVSFDTNWGGPADIVFTNLDDWSSRGETGIKYYSGQAVYRTTFDLPNTNPVSAPTPLYLSLGNVQVMASVKLNGQALGIVWCAPWRTAIPPGALRTRGNVLEITVANLWPNRMIGDQFLPAAKRYCWCSIYPFTTSSSLLPSGLLGPVTLQMLVN